MRAHGFSWSHLGLVAAGGAIGTGVRAVILLVEHPDWSLWSVPLINLVGALLLGVVTGLAERFGDSSRSRAFRQFFGAGVLGGFTTYSTFAAQTAVIQPAELVLGAATVALGAVAAWVGLRLGRRA